MEQIQVQDIKDLLRRVKPQHQEDAGGGMYNIRLSLFTNDLDIYVQHYPNDDYENVWVLFFYENEEEGSIGYQNYYYEWENLNEVVQHAIVKSIHAQCELFEEKVTLTISVTKAQEQKLKEMGIIE